MDEKREDVMGMTDEELRSYALKRVKEKREFRQHLVSYVIVNAALIGIWAVTSRGSFWPGWVLGGWGIGLAFHAWNTFFSRPITDADIENEIERLRGKR
jgi:2TM domain